MHFIYFINVECKYSRFVRAGHRDYGRSSQGAQWGWVFDHPVLSEDIKIFVLLNDQGPDQG
eukprot:COSAG02_NODE_57034_length_282_cov_0.978142_1_plen_60_part_01